MMRPFVGSSKPPTMRSVVVLPQPEGPSRVTSSPGFTSKSASRTACTSAWDLGSRKVLDTDSSLTGTGVVAMLLPHCAETVFSRCSLCRTRRRIRPNTASTMTISVVDRTLARPNRMFSEKL